MLVLATLRYIKIEQMVHEKALKKKLFLGPLRQASGQKQKAKNVSRYVNQNTKKNIRILVP